MQPKGEKEVHVVEADHRSICLLEVPRWAQEGPILASNKDVPEGISQVQFGRQSTQPVLDDESFHIIEGTIEASEGIKVNMIIDGVLWRPRQIMYDPILDRE